jgi:hypothetical protein
MAEATEGEEPESVSYVRFYCFIHRSIDAFFPSPTVASLSAHLAHMLALIQIQNLHQWLPLVLEAKIHAMTLFRAWNLF